MHIHEKGWEQIERLETNELLIARLYTAYSEHFSDHRNFWKEMAEEEKKHANMISTLLHEIREGSVRLGDNRFDTTSIGMFQDYLKAQLTKAKEEVLSQEDAFQAALAIEHDLLERSFFNVFESDSPEMKIILEALEAATRQHRRKLVEAIEESQES